MRIGRYELLNGIARGGMAEIFLARDTSKDADHRCIVKRLLPAMASHQSMLDMFLDEGRVTALFDHPNVVGCKPPERFGDTWLLAMDYVEGTNLGRLLSYIDGQGFRLPLPLCAYVVCSVASGLQHAHDIIDPRSGRPLRVVHRDVTPDNILIGVRGEVKIADFGIASGDGRRTKTRHGQVKGKVSYMAPEQVSCSELDGRADVFSLGIVMHELLTGRPLFGGAADFIVMQRIVRQTAAAPSTINDAVDADLDDICMKALHKDREARFQQAGEMATALRAWLQRRGFHDAAPVFADWLRQLSSTS